VPDRIVVVVVGWS